MLTLLFASFCARAFAFPLLAPKSCDPVVEQVDFNPARDGLASLRLPVSLMTAAHKITLFDENGKSLDTCSSSAVSEDGNLLTAGHCIDACLTALTHESEGLTLLDPARLNESKCTIKVDGQDSSLQILATNACRFRKDLPIGTSRQPCSGLDYALLKIDPNVLHSPTCLKIADQLPKIGAAVASMGFSQRTLRSPLRKAAQDSNGALSVSSGNVIPFQTFCQPEVDASSGYFTGRDNFSQAQRNENLRQHVADGSILQTSGAEFIQGGSGGALIDEQTSQLLGVASFEIENSKYVECRGSTFFSSAAGMLKEIRAENPQLNLGQALNCQKHAANSL